MEALNKMGSYRKGVEAVIARKRGGTPTGNLPPKSIMVAWYDGADATDSVGSYNLTESGAGPFVYTDSALNGSATASWAQANLDDNFANTAQDWSLILNFEATDTITNGAYIMSMQSGRVNVRWLTSGFQVRIGDILVSTGHVPVVSIRYSIYLEYDHSETRALCIVNADAADTATGTFSATTGQVGIGNNHSFKVYYAGFFDRILTQSEYEEYTLNESTDRTYADHP